jgi:hypothetical protein
LSKNQQKATFNQAKTQQDWEMNQYQKMWGPSGSARTTFAPVTEAANALLTGGGETPQMAADIAGGKAAAQKQAASSNAATYANISDELRRARARQSGYSPGFDTNQQAIARQAAEQGNLSAVQPEEWAANTDLATRMQGLGLGGNLAQEPYAAQLQALGMTNADIANMIAQQGNIATAQKGPLANVEDIARIATAPLRVNV